nr:hypothetical protein [Rhodospirillales bacterium]
MAPSIKLINRQKSANSLLFFLISLLSYSNFTEANPKIVPIDGVNYSVSSTLIDNLKTLQGRKVTLTLNSGKDITGIIKEISDHLLHIEKLERKEFYDSLVHTKDISAVETRFREMKR